MREGVCQNIEPADDEKQEECDVEEPFFGFFKFFFCGASTHSVLGRLIVEVSRSHAIRHIVPIGLL
jgi:hypothetical protein